jgi:hypothetical protein
MMYIDDGDIMMIPCSAGADFELSLQLPLACNISNIAKQAQ